MNGRIACIVAAGFVGALFPALARGSDLVLKPVATPPATCPVSPVYGASAGGTRFPFMRAEPLFSDITLRLLNHPVGHDYTYEPLRLGDLPISWTDTQTRQTGISVTAQELGGPGERFRKLYASDLEQNLTLPHAGCWRLQIQRGVDRGTLTLWVGK